MKVHGDDHPGVLTLSEIKSQIALGTLTKRDLHTIIHQYEMSKYYLPEDVLTFLEEFLAITIKHKNKFYLRDDASKNT